MGGIELMIRILSDSSQELQLLAAETLANLAKFKGARRIVRKQGGIPKLVQTYKYHYALFDLFHL